MSTNKPGYTGIKRIIKATGFSIQGLQAALKNEAAVRQEFALLLIGTPIALLMSFSIIEQVLLVGVLLIIVIVELLNSAIEAVVDRVGPEIHELSGRAKDIGSAAVFMALILAGFTWIMIFIGSTRLCVE